ncbi:hypothetical protein T484DRAFT_1638101, partial [Baffinella frigidus]
NHETWNMSHKTETINHQPSTIAHKKTKPNRSTTSTTGLSIIPHNLLVLTLIVPLPSGSPINYNPNPIRSTTTFSRCAQRPTPSGKSTPSITPVDIRSTTLRAYGLPTVGS